MHEKSFVSKTADARAHRRMNFDAGKSHGQRTGVRQTATGKQPRMSRLKFSHRVRRISAEVANFE